MCPTVLCVDADPSRRASTEQVLHEATPRGTTVVELGSVAGVAEYVEGGSVDCLVTEYGLPDGTGFDACAVAREAAPDAGCVLYTGTDLAAITPGEHRETVVEPVPRAEPEGPAELAHLVSDLLRLRTHTAYPVAPDEHERVAAVARYAAVFDDAKESLDRLCDLATAHFGTEVAFVSLIDANDQRYLSRTGFPVANLPRQETVCTYTLFDEGVTVVEDLETDPLFGANETLGRIGLHAYAGARLRTDDGHVIGTFCVLDDEPRTFSADERAFLETLAEEAMAMLSLHRRLTDVEGW
jgi:hypothetical protein